MSAATRLMDNLRLRVPGAVDGAIQLELFNAIDEFSRITKAWTDVIEVSLVLGVSGYTLSVPGAKIVEVISVAHTSLPLNDTVYSDGNLDVGSGPVATDLLSPLFVTVALAPAADPATDFATWLPDSLVADYYHVFLDGALERMFSQIAKPYTSAPSAAYHRRRFRNGMAEARAFTTRGGVQGAQPWAFPRWA